MQGTSSADSNSLNIRVVATRMFNLVRVGFDELTLQSTSNASPSGIKVALTDGNATVMGQGLTKPALLNADGTVSDNALQLVKGKSVEIILSSLTSIDLEFDLPSSPLSDLRGMIDAEILYRSPFGEGQAYSIWNAQETASGSWRIKAAVTLKSVLDPILESLKFAGAGVSAIRRANEQDKPGFSARPSWAIGDQRRSLEPLLDLVPQKFILPGLVLAAFIVSTFLLHVQTGISLSRLQNRADNSRVELAQAARLAQSQRNIFLLEKSSLQRLALPGTLTRALPDEVWLEQIDIDSQTVTVSGFGPSAADVTRLMTGLSGLVEVGFASPVTRDNTQNIERFRIGAEFDVEGFTVD